MSLLRRRILPGLILGFVLSWLGFGDYTELHGMFTFTEPRLVLVFAGAVVLNAAFMWSTGARRMLAPVAVSWRVVVGGVLFGLGWVISAGCPGVVLVQIGEGRLPAVVTLLGVALGAAVVGRLRQPELQGPAPVLELPGAQPAVVS